MSNTQFPNNVQLLNSQSTRFSNRLGIEHWEFFGHWSLGIGHLLCPVFPQMLLASFLDDGFSDDGGDGSADDESHNHPSQRTVTLRFLFSVLFGEWPHGGSITLPG